MGIFVCRNRRSSRKKKPKPPAIKGPLQTLQQNLLALPQEQAFALFFKETGLKGIPSENPSLVAKEKNLEETETFLEKETEIFEEETVLYLEEKLSSKEKTLADTLGSVAIEKTDSELENVALNSETLASESKIPEVLLEKKQGLNLEKQELKGKAENLKAFVAWHYSATKDEPVYEWVVAKLPVAFKMETQIYDALILADLGLATLKERTQTELQGHSPIFLSTRSNVVRSGCITVYKANFEIITPLDQSLGYKNLYTVTFPVPRTMEGQAVVAHLAKLEITVAGTVKFKYKLGTCKAQKGKKFGKPLCI